MVYFIQRLEGGPIKIGKTSRLTYRLNNLIKEHKTKLKVLAVMDGGLKQERLLHKQFAELRIRKTEWFHPEPELLRFIKKDAAPWDGKDDVVFVGFGCRHGLLYKLKVASAFSDVRMGDYIAGLLDRSINADLVRLFAEEGHDIDPSRFDSR